MSDPPTVTRRASLRVGLLLLAVGSLLLIVGSSLIGPTALEWFSAPWWQLRGERTLKAALVGAALAFGGAVFQQLFRNPLATPYTLGVASGASLASAIGFFTGISGVWLGVPVQVWLALSGSAVVMALVASLALRSARRDLTPLLLAGVAVAYLCSSGIMLVTYLADRTITARIAVWLMGSLSTLDPEAPRRIAVVLGVAAAVILAQHRSLELLRVDAELAETRGVPVQRVIWSCYGLIGVLVAVVVAHCGPIGFVGMMVPHVVRAMIGERSGPLLIGSLIAGAAFLSVCDSLARSVTLFELPVGIVTNTLGAIFFLGLLIRGGRGSALRRS